MPEQTSVYKLNINGMHCASCVVLIEQKAKQLPGIIQANVSLKHGTAELFGNNPPDLNKLNQAINSYGYYANWAKTKKQKIKPVQPVKPNYMEIGMIFLMVIAIYIILKTLNLIPEGFGLSNNMSYGVIFGIGLVAAFSSCIAVTGGLLVAVAEKYYENHTELTAFQKFKPHLYFNAGRIISYTVLGAAVGALGSAFKFSGTVTGLITILASLAMILMALQLLHIFPKLSSLHIRMPKFIGHKVHDLGKNNTKATPFLLGAATFFLPCGFTQALQLYVLSQGSPLQGGLTMLIFSLGTLPALLSLGIISSAAKGNFQKFFLKFSAVVILLLGITNIKNGFALTGVYVKLPPLFGPATTASSQQKNTAIAAEVINGKQIAKMKVDGYSYIPSQFVVKTGVPVEWQIDGSDSAGCSFVVVAPKLAISQILNRYEPTIISFTPKTSGEIAFSCPMGMTTKGAKFIVED